MRVFRIVREKYLDTALSGRGVQLSKGFQWNSYGTPMVYTAESRSLAALEVAVHLDFTEDLLTDRYLVEIEVPVELEILTLPVSDLPKGWDAKPPGRVSQHIGYEFINGNAAPVLRVPSSIIPQEFNFLLNPAHEDFSQIKISKRVRFGFDSRLSFS
jgi:RES domain-containing protein